MNKDQILRRIQSIFDVPVMQNNFRGLWAEMMVAELLGPNWKHVGTDWMAWDIERADGRKIEVKQSAAHQSWGISTSAPRFSITAPKGYYPDGKRYQVNPEGNRLADLYIFAWHEGKDQRLPSEWQFYVVQSNDLPENQKSIGLGTIKRLATEVTADDLLGQVEKLLHDLA